MNQTLAIARKEVLHIIRDPRSLIVAILMPLFMVLLYGYAIDMEIRNIPVAIMDHDHSSASRDLVEQMTSGGFIVDAARIEQRDEIVSGFRSGKFRAALIIPEGYSRDLLRHEDTGIQLLIDGADASSAHSVENYLQAVIGRINIDLRRELLGDKVEMPISTRTRFFFNPELSSPNFVVPGLIVVIMVMICALLTSIAVTREKETGTLEQILTAPIDARSVMIGKVLPYMILAIIDAVLVLLSGIFVFHVPMNGSWLVLGAYGFEYLLISLAFGLLISAITNTQQIAMMIALLATLLPSLILSGFLFAIESMPLVLQIIARFIPATYFLVVIRGIMLAGRAWFPLEGGLMLIMAVGLMALAMKKFKSRLE